MRFEFETNYAAVSSEASQAFPVPGEPGQALLQTKHSSPPWVSRTGQDRPPSVRESHRYAPMNPLSGGKT
jgi:hypothetical protein